MSPDGKPSHIDGGQPPTMGDARGNGTQDQTQTRRKSDEYQQKSYLHDIFMRLLSLLQTGGA